MPGIIAAEPVVVDSRRRHREENKKNRPENRFQTTTSPLVVQNPVDWPVGRENFGHLLAPETFVLRKGERGVVRGNPLALWRGADPSFLKRLSPVGWLLTKLFATSLSSSRPLLFLSLLQTNMDNRKSNARMNSPLPRNEFERAALR
jgi:hypothetical protein